MKILCTGNPTLGICKHLQELYPDATFISRTSGYDLDSEQGQAKFKDIIADYDVFINHSQLGRGTQAKLLSITRQVWDKGQVINIGSVIELPKWQWIEPDAAADKIALRDLSLDLLTEDFRTTHMMVGGLSSCDNDPMRLDPLPVAVGIKWVLENDTDIPLIYLDKISNELTKKWMAMRP